MSGFQNYKQALKMPMDKYKTRLSMLFSSKKEAL